MRVGVSARKEAGFLAAHATACLEVAEQKNSIVMVRVPGKFVPGLVTQGYASKGYHNKTKSCNWGPMAGFVLNHPLFSKAGLTRKGQEKQVKYIYNARAHGAGRTQVKLTQIRLDELVRTGIIKRRQTSKGTKAKAGELHLPPTDRKGSRIWEYQATMKDCKGEVVYDDEARKWINFIEEGKKYVFILQEKSVANQCVWKVYYEKKRPGAPQQRPIIDWKPVYSLTDRLWDPQVRQQYPQPVQQRYVAAGQQMPEYKKATSGDYDLFAVWHKLGRWSRSEKYQRKVGPDNLKKYWSSGIF